MKLRHIFNTVSETLAKAHSLSPTERRAARDEVCRFLAAQGFQYLGGGASSSAYSHEDWGGVVLKFSSFGVDTPSKEGLAMLGRHWLKPLFSSRHCMVQPQADTRLAWEAQAKILATLGREDFDPSRAFAPYDLHEENVGFYRGRAVAFDTSA